MRFPFTGIHWRSPAGMLMVMSAAMYFSFSAWQALLNNFAVQEAAFTGREIGMLQSIREVPGFLAFMAIYLIFLMREQTLAMISLALLGVGVAITGYFPTVIGLYATTLIMSLGFHYYECMYQSLSLQWFEKKEAPAILGKIVGVGAFAQLAAYGLIFIAWEALDISFQAVYLIAGGSTVLIVVVLFLAYPYFEQKVEQRRQIVIRRRYWLYYALTFMGGARRQIFVVFAAFLMVEKFGFSVAQISLLFLVNCVFNMFMAPLIGRLIGIWGERKALMLEYAGLIIVFTAYAFVNNPWMAAGLYIVDHAFFAVAIAISTYFQKIADPGDFAGNAGVSFTINHIAAVFIPVLFGLIWLWSPAAVFLLGAGMAAISLVLAMMVPRHPEPGRELAWQPTPSPQPAE